MLVSQRSCCRILTLSANGLAPSRCLLSSPYSKIQIQVEEITPGLVAWVHIAPSLM